MKESALPVASLAGQLGPNVLPLRGEIDLNVSPVVTELLDAMTEKRLERIVIDLSRATYIDSAGLAVLIVVMQEVQAFGGKFFLSGLNQTMRSIFETSRLNRIFQIFPDVDAALSGI
jgi:anti-sigma B factor antagonist